MLWHEICLQGDAHLWRVEVARTRRIPYEGAVKSFGKIPSRIRQIFTIINSVTLCSSLLKFEAIPKIVNYDHISWYWSPEGPLRKPCFSPGLQNRTRSLPTTLNVVERGPDRPGAREMHNAGRTFGTGRPCSARADR
jgi:hypothetical protein